MLARPVSPGRNPRRRILMNARCFREDRRSLGTVDMHLKTFSVWQPIIV